MKITNFSIVRLMEQLAKYEDAKLPQKINYIIAKDVIALRTKYNIYIKKLNEINERYKENFERDEEGNLILNNSGLPIINRNNEAGENYDKEIQELLNMPVEVDMNKADKEVFDFADNDRYDVLTPRGTMDLMSILCL